MVSRENVKLQKLGSYLVEIFKVEKLSSWENVFKRRNRLFDKG